MQSWWWRRRNYLINKDFQFRFIGRNLFGMVVMALIVAFTVYYATWARIMDEFYNIPRIAAQFAPLFHSVNRTIVLILVLFLVGAALVSVFTSHRIAGPVYRFEKVMEAIGRGDMTLRVDLRRDDEFQHLAETFNSMLDQLRAKLHPGLEALASLDGMSRRLGTPAKKKGAAGKATAKAPAKATAKDLAELAQALELARQTLGKLKIQG